METSLSLMFATFLSVLGLSRDQAREVIEFITKRAEIINIQPRDGKGKPYQVKQVRELLLKYKIALE